MSLSTLTQFFIFFTFLTTHAHNPSSSSILKPNCNYVALAVQYVPIGACLRGVNNTSVKYKCMYHRTRVYKALFNNGECSKYPHTLQDVTTSVQHFECCKRRCDYVESCSFSGCNNRTKCADCQKHPSNFTRSCSVFITNQCYGLKNALLRYNECKSKEVTTELFAGNKTNGVCKGNATITETRGGELGSANQCLVDKKSGKHVYYQVKCKNRCRCKSYVPWWKVWHGYHHRYWYWNRHKACRDKKTKRDCHNVNGCRWKCKYYYY